MGPDKRPLDLTEATKKDMDLCLLTGIEFLGDALVFASYEVAISTEEPSHLHPLRPPAPPRSTQTSSTSPMAAELRK